MFARLVTDRTEVLRGAIQEKSLSSIKEVYYEVFNKILTKTLFYHVLICPKQQTIEDKSVERTRKY